MMSKDTRPRVGGKALEGNDSPPGDVSSVGCPACGHRMLKVLGVARPAADMLRFFEIPEACTQWECPRCFSKVFVGVDSGNTYPWRDPVGWGG